MIEQLKERALELQPELVAIRRHLHQNPELSYQEFETAKYIRSLLDDWGVPWQPLCDTGTVAMIEGKRGGRVIALRADIDALPIQEANGCDYASQNSGVMHACGHDVHTTSLLGVIRLLHKNKGALNGSVKCIFQLGEEKLPGGASMMIKEGVLKSPNVEHILGQHVFPELEVGKVGFRPGKYMASADEIYLKVKGKGGHAALPANNIDPVLMASHIVVALQQVVSRRANPSIPSVLSFGDIHGHGATNVIPNEVALAGTFRTFDEHWRFEAHDRIREIATGVATSMGGTCEVVIRVGYPFVKNDEALTQRCQRLAKEFLGAENVVDLDLRMTAEDFSFYAQEVPGCFYRLGTKPSGEPHQRGLHTPTFDVDEQCLHVGAGLMAWMAMNELNTTTDR